MIAVGQVVGRLTVLGFERHLHVSRSGRDSIVRLAVCKCACGTERCLVRAASLVAALVPDARPGHRGTRSCGCLRREVATSPKRWRRGSDVHTSRLTEAQVRDIRARFGAGASKGSLAREYGVSQPAVTKIVNRTAWRHVA